MRTDNSKTTVKKILGIKFERTGLVQNHADLSKHVQLFVNGREQRLEKIIEKQIVEEARKTARILVNNHELATEQDIKAYSDLIRKCKLEAEFLIVQKPIASSSPVYPRVESVFQ